MFQTVVSGFILAILASLLHRITKKFSGWLIALFPICSFIFFCNAIPTVLSSPITQTTHWVPILGINLTFYLDGLSLIFALLITGIGVLIILYGSEYLKGNPSLGEFYTFILIFMSSMLGLVLSSNLITLFIFWELTSLSSFFLIGFFHEKAESRKAALQSLIVTGVGGLALLVGFLLVASQFGSFQLLDILSNPGALHGNSFYPVILLLIFWGAFSKSAQIPFHFWLPAAMAAPTPVSAYLHSATMVKAGIYLLARLTPVLGGTELWSNTLIIVGGLTMLLAAFRSWMELELKKILAYSTISVLGTLVLLIGVGTPAAIKAMIIFLVAHALSKGALFLIAGAIDHSTGIKDISKLQGLKKFMPMIAVAGILATLSKIGFPPFFGFIGKELIYEGLIYSSKWSQWLISLAVITNIFLIVAIWSVGVKPFFGKPFEQVASVHRTSWALWICPLLLGVGGFIYGIFPHFIEPLSLNAVAAIQPPTIEGLLSESSQLKLWHGFSKKLMLSILTLIGGFTLYVHRQQAKAYLSVVRNVLIKCDPQHWYDFGMEALRAVATWQTKILQSGYLRYYLRIILITAIILIGAKLIDANQFLIKVNWGEIPFYETGLCAIILIAAIGATFTRTLLAGIMVLGVVGYGIALIYVIYGAPDLALTQFLIETLTVVLFLSILSKLPDMQSFYRHRTYILDLIVSVGIGGLVTGLMLMMNSVKSQKLLSEFFANQSYIDARGRNVVNTIIVDFRALDTLGEITVLAIAGMGVYALLKSRRTKNEN